MRIIIFVKKLQCELSLMRAAAGDAPGAGRGKSEVEVGGASVLSGG